MAFCIVSASSLLLIFTSARTQLTRLQVPVLRALDVRSRAAVYESSHIVMNVARYYIRNSFLGYSTVLAHKNICRDNIIALHLLLNYFPEEHQQLRSLACQDALAEPSNKFNKNWQQ